MPEANRPAIRILLADDHGIVRTGLQRILEIEPDLRVVGQAVDGRQVLARVEDTPCDILLLDITMPAPSGPTLIGQLRRSHPGLAILVVSMHDTPAVVRAALHAGASGYITKDSHPDTLVAAIRQVAAGESFIDERLAEAVAGVDMSPHARLSPRELQILRLLAAGKSNHAIAQALFLSEKTISSHKANLMAKLSLKSLAELVRYADSQGLIGSETA